MAAVLRQANEQGNPPITVNPDHVVSLSPRKTYRPNLASQSGGLHTGYEGTQIELVTGRTVLVVESHQEAHEKLWPRPVAQTPPVGASPTLEAAKAEAQKATEAAPEKPEPKKVPPPSPKKEPEPAEELKAQA
jgi:hypothetical protein